MCVVSICWGSAGGFWFWNPPKSLLWIFDFFSFSWNRLNCPAFYGLFFVFFARVFSGSGKGLIWPFDGTCEFLNRCQSLLCAKICCQLTTLALPCLCRIRKRCWRGKFHPKRFEKSDLWNHCVFLFECALGYRFPLFSACYRVTANCTFVFFLFSNFLLTLLNVGVHSLLRYGNFSGVVSVFFFSNNQHFYITLELFHRGFSCVYKKTCKLFLRLS